MLDNSCKDDSLDGCSVPRVQGGFLHARCVCGLSRRVATTTMTDSPACEQCGQSTADGLLAGPDRAAIVKLIPRQDDADNVVYFARVANLIKIGTTRNLWRRMTQLGGPELLGILPGGHAVERQHHQRFADERIHGEVFAASPRLLAYIDEHCTLPEPEPASTPRGRGIPAWKHGL